MYYIIFTTNKHRVGCILPVVANSEEEARQKCIDNYMANGSQFMEKLLVLTQEQYDGGYRYVVDDVEKDVRELFKLATIRRGKTILRENGEF